MHVKANRVTAFCTRCVIPPAAQLIGTELETTNFPDLLIVTVLAIGLAAIVAFFVLGIKNLAHWFGFAVCVGVGSLEFGVFSRLISFSLGGLLSAIVSSALT